jgi:hypothetical protein
LPEVEATEEQTRDGLRWVRAKRKGGDNRHAKDSGLSRLPSREFALNQAWLVAVMHAADLVAWTRMLACTDDAAVLALCEPQALRYRFIHVAARLARSSRRRSV